MLTKLKKGIFKNKNVLVVGLARSGIGAANLLSSFGAKVCITDVKSQDSLRDNIERLLPSIKVVTDGHPEEIFNTADLIVVSPGVSLNTPPLIHAKTKGIPIIGELELAYQIVTSKIQSIGHATRNTQHATRNMQHVTPAFVGITGTNGKSTTTTLVNLMLRKSGFRTLLGGNIGNALTEEIYSRFTVHGSRFTGVDYIVTEVSSFQLESIQDFKPFIAVILNITPDHLNRHSSIGEYVDTKARIFKNQETDDYLILNADDPITTKLKSEKLEVKSREKPKVLFFSRKKEVDGIYLRDGRLYYNLLSTRGTAPPAFLRKQERGTVSPPFDFIAADEIKIKGVHNLENAMAASMIAFICGCSNEAIRDVLKDFPGLEHRLEFVCEIDGVSFINDSKGTNASAVVRSLESLQNVVLIMGGRDKDGDFTVLKDLIKEKVKSLILLGEAKEKIAKAVGEVTETIFVKDIKEAVELSILKASVGDVVMLSPGCASFDMFRDFEERGRRFKETIKEYEIQKSKIKNQNCG